MEKKYIIIIGFLLIVLAYQCIPKPTGELERLEIEDIVTYDGIHKCEVTYVVDIQERLPDFKHSEVIILNETKGIYAIDDEAHVKRLNGWTFLGYDRSIPCVNSSGTPTYIQFILKNEDNSTSWENTFDIDNSKINYTNYQK